MKKILLSFLLGVSFILSVSGQQYQTWFFGNNAGLKFNGLQNPSALAGSSMVTNEGCAVSMDNNGNVLFYTNGIDVWHGANHSNLTSPGNALLGSLSSTQPCVIVPIPGSKFIVFTTGGVETGTQNLGVCLISVTGNFPNHIVSVSSSENLIASNIAEKLAITSDGNNGWWVIAHDFYLSGTAMYGNKFHKFHINTAPSNYTTLYDNVTSTSDLLPILNSNYSYSLIGSKHNGSMFSGQGQMKFSKSGTKLGLVIAGNKKMEIFDFNPSNGNITLTYLKQFTDSNHKYGFEFSPNGQLAYVADGWCPLPQTSANIYQIDLSTSSYITSIIDSYLVNSPGGIYNGLQLGPDNKIYVCGPKTIGTSQTRLSKIPYPNNSGSINCPLFPLSNPVSGTVAVSLPLVCTIQSIQADDQVICFDNNSKLNNATIFVTTSKWPVIVKNLSTGSIVGTFYSNPIILSPSITTDYIFSTTLANGYIYYDKVNVKVIGDNVVSPLCPPVACSVFKSTQSQPLTVQNSIDGPKNVSHFWQCDRSIVLDGTCSSHESGVYIWLQEFDLLTWSGIGTLLYDGWYQTSGSASSNIDLFTLATNSGNAIIPGHVYAVSFVVGPTWTNELQPNDIKFFTVDVCPTKIGEISSESNGESSNLYISKSSEISISPNPTNGKFNIDLNDVTAEKVIIYNMLGKVVSETSVTENARSLDIDLSELPASVYMVHVHTGSEVILKKVIKN